jgi:CHAD domain-containing protein
MKFAAERETRGGPASPGMKSRGLSREPVGTRLRKGGWMTRRTVRALVEIDPTPGALRESLIDAGLHPGSGEIVERRLLDSFDWRVWNAGAVLQHDSGPDPGWLVWRRRATAHKPERMVACQHSASTPSMIDDLEEGPVRTQLAPVLEKRALLPRATLRLEREHFRLLDDEDKTVARAMIEQTTLIAEGDAGDPDDAAEKDLGSRVVVTGVRGYDRAFKRLVQRLRRNAGLVAEPCGVDRQAFEAAGAHPGDYSSKLRLTIAPELPALRAFTTICSSLLDGIETNDPGVRRDIDSEFLHDFRVAIRRTRSMLSQAQGTIPDAVRDHYRDEFKWIFAISSELRDLDVYLLDFDELVAPLPVASRADLGPLRELLVELRRDAHARMVFALDTPRYRELIADWRAFLDAPAHGAANSAPVSRVARERIWKAYQGVARHGRRITARTPAPAVHDVRKRAKKLRYLLEAYGSIYPDDQMEALVSELKKLQDNLGQFQDSEVQADSLRRFAHLLDRRPGRTTPAVRAMGLLTDRLTQQQQQARREFHQRFDRFDRRKNRDRFRRLFEPVPGSVS